MNDQAGADSGRLGDGAQPDAESVLAELRDGRVPDPSGCGQIG